MPKPLCGFTGCNCEHETCSRGWLDLPDNKTAPCPICRPQLHDIIQNTDPEDINEAATNRTQQKNILRVL